MNRFPTQACICELGPWTHRRKEMTSVGSGVLCTLHLCPNSKAHHTCIAAAVIVVVVVVVIITAQKLFYPTCTKITFDQVSSFIQLTPIKLLNTMCTWWAQMGKWRVTLILLFKWIFKSLHFSTFKTYMKEIILKSHSKRKA